MKKILSILFLLSMTTLIACNLKANPVSKQTTGQSFTEAILPENANVVDCYDEIPPPCSNSMILNLDNKKTDGGKVTKNILGGNAKDDAWLAYAIANDDNSNNFGIISTQPKGEAKPDDAWSAVQNDNSQFVAANQKSTESIATAEKKEVQDS